MPDSVASGTTGGAAGGSAAPPAAPVERRLRFLLALSDELHRRADPAEVAAAAAEALGRYLGAAHARFDSVDATQGVAEARRGSTRDGGIAAPGGVAGALDAFGPAVMANLKAGRSLAIEDCDGDPRTTLAKARDSIGCRALLVVPVVRDGHLHAILALQDSAPRHWGEDEIALAEDVAARSWEAFERARSHQALREDERRCRALFEAMDEGLLVGELLLDAAGRPRDLLCLEANPAAVRMIGQDPTGKRLSEIDPSIEPAWFEAWAQVARTGEARRFHRYAAPLRTWFDFHVSRQDAGGADSRRIAIVFQDATERRQTEAALRESEARFRHMADSAPALIWMTDAEGRVTFANMHYDHLFGRPATEMQGQGWRDVILPEDVERFQAAFQEAFQARQPFRAEVRVRDRHGEVRWLRCEGVPRLDDAHRFLGYTGCNLDITDAKVAEAELRQMAETLEQRVAEALAERGRAEAALRQAQKMEAVGQLTGGVAHDFNNLLTIIRSSTELLRRPGLPEERRRRYVDAIAETVDRAAKLTGQLLAFARRQALKPEVFDVVARVRAVADMLRSILGAGIRIDVQAAGERCFAEADVSQFETALVNMAVNARDAMEGEGTLTMRVEAVPRMPPIRGHGGGPGAFVAVSIADTGAGIPPDRLPRIFEPFFTTKEVGKGTGLGLSQVYGFAKQSGGDVAVESEPGRGTTFRLYLPRVECAAVVETRPADDAARLPLPQGDGRRVLLVEDNLGVGRFSTQILQDLGYETTWASSAAEALALLEEAPPRFDVVFSDVVMPGMSGIELAAAIRRRHPGLPVILTSGYSHVLAEEGRHGFELLQKPYAIEELSRVLRQATRQRTRPEADAAQAGAPGRLA